MSAKASGSDARANGAAKSRDHNQGNQDRKWTPQQKAEVIRIRRCSPTAFYEILAIEKTSSDGEIKKAYRKISLLTHPDKNGYEGADEAFKMVSRAFQVLSDADKKSRYDQFGGDPDNRFSSSGAAGGGASPFSGFARSAGGRMPSYDDEISPEELFNRFFGGGGAFGGPFGGFGGPQFVFNMGGGPGFTVHRMGGQTPRRRPAQSGQTEAGPTGIAALTQLLPLFLLFVLPLLSSLFSGTSSTPTPIRFDAAIPPQTKHIVSSRYKIDYFVNPEDVEGWKPSKFNYLDIRAETEYISSMQYRCGLEMNKRQREINEATGFFYTDEVRLREAREMPMPSCQRLDELEVSRQY